MVLRNVWSLLHYAISLKEVKIWAFIINAAILLYSIFHIKELYANHSIWLFIILVLFNVVWQFLSTIADIVQLFKDSDYYFDNKYRIDFTDLKLSEDVKKRYDKTTVNEDNQIITIHSDEINASLRERKEILIEEINANKTVLHDYIEQEKDKSLLFLKTKWHHDKKVNFYNEDKLCMVSEIDIQRGKVNVCKGNYYNSFVTNEMFCKRLCHNTKSHYVLPPLNPFVQSITSLSRDSLFSNHIGASGLLMTIDGYIIILEHNNKTAVSPNLFQPTCSGSSDYIDWTAQKKKQQFSLQSVIEEIVLRELKEETCVNRDQVTKIELIGFFRNLKRGGKPDFCSLIHSSLTADQFCDIFVPEKKEIKNPPVRIKIKTGDTFDLSDFICFLDNHKGKISPPLYLSYVFLKEMYS